MTWFRVDDTLAAHPKTRRAGLAAMGLWTVSGSWSSQQLTEGFVPSWFVDTWPQGKKLAAQLVRAGYWQPTEQDGEPGWLFHDWTDANPAAEAEKERRRKARERQKRMREKSVAKREEAFDKALEDDPSPSASRVTSRVTDNVSHAVSHGAPSLPVPTLPSLPTEERVGGYENRGGYVPNARDTPPQTFPDHCPQHADDPVPPPCGGCQKQKALNAAAPRAPLALVADRKRCIVHDLSYATVCNGCEADRKAAS